MEAIMDFESFSRDDYLKVQSLENVDFNEMVKYLKNKTHIEKLFVLHSSKIEREFKELSLIKSLVSITIKITNGDDNSIKALSNMTNLTSLYIEKHWLTYEGVKELSMCSNLTTLTIRDSRIQKINKLFIKGIASVYAKSLAKLTNLTELDLRDSLINDEFVKVLAENNCSHNITRLNLSNNNIGNLALSAVAKSPNFPNLADLLLKNTNIGLEGVKALVLSYNFKNLLWVELEGTDLPDIEGIEELAMIMHPRKKPRFYFGETQDRLYVFLKKVLSNKIALEKILESHCGLFKMDRNQGILMYILTHKEKYQVRLNSVLKASHKLCIFSHFLGQPETEKYLFELGALPAAISFDSWGEKTELQVIAQDSQSVHMTSVVKKTIFCTKYLIDSVKTTMECVEQSLLSFNQDIQSLLRRYQNDPIRLKLLNLSNSEKICIMKTTLCGRPLPSDKEFVESVIQEATRTLEEKYNRVGSDYSTAKMQYDSTRSEATVTIPQCIGYIKLLIDTFPIPINEKIELLVTVMQQNPNLAKEKLKMEFSDRPQLYEWSKNMTNENIGHLFLTVSGLDIEQIWREQKEFVLLKQIYMSATAYGEDNSACVQGIWSQIIASLDEIDFKLLDRYEQHLDRQRDRERLMPTISRDNSSRLANHLARKLIEYSAFRPEVRRSLEDFVFGIIDMKNFENITFEQQKIFSKLNCEFTCNVKNFLPNYEREIPTTEEYGFIIENVLNSKPLQDFVKGVCTT